MPNIRIIARRYPSRASAKFSSRRKAREAVRDLVRRFESTPAWERGFNPVNIHPARQAGAYGLRDFYKLTGLSPRLERHYHVALGS